MTTLTTDPSLVDLIDWAALEPMPRYAGGHDDQMKGLFKDATLLSHWNEEDYQGTVAVAHCLPDGRVAVIADSYGSCSGCDAWEASSWEDAKSLLCGLAGSALVFPDITSCREWLKLLESDEEAALQRLQLNIRYAWDSKTARGLLANWTKE